MSKAAYRYIRGQATGSGRRSQLSRDESLSKLIKNREGNRILLAAVADCTRAFPSGTFPSSIAIDMVRDYFNSEYILDLNKNETDENICATIRDLFDRINTVLYSQGISEGQAEKASLSVVLIIGEMLYAGHVGTGKILLMEETSPIQLTQENAWLEALKQGKFATEMGAQPPVEEETPLLGTEGKVPVQLMKEDLELGDRVAVLTDGIGEYIPNQEILVLLKSTRNISDACKRLTAIALERGLLDNGTILAVHIDPTRERDEVFDQPVVELKPKEKKSSGCGGFYLIVILLLLSVIAGGSYIGYEHAKVLWKNLTAPFTQPIPTETTPEPEFTKAGSFYMAVEKDSALLSILRLNSTKMDPSQENFELTEAYNQVEILPTLAKGTYTLEIKINNKNFYEVHESSSRNKIAIFADNIKIYLTKGALATLIPNETNGVTHLKVSGLGSPSLISFPKENIMVKATLDPIPEPTKPAEKGKKKPAGKETAKAKPKPKPKEEEKIVPAPTPLEDQTDSDTPSPSDEEKAPETP